MIVAGIMSGTSADGINVALVRVGTSRTLWTRATRPRAFHSPGLAFKFLAQAEYPYPKECPPSRPGSHERERSQRSQPGPPERPARRTLCRSRSSHPTPFPPESRTDRLPRPDSLPSGRACEISGPQPGRHLADRRRRSAGGENRCPGGLRFPPRRHGRRGQRRPLVPFLDYLLYRDPQIGRIVQNIGGIANLTAIPVGASPKQVTAFDTGPGNMVIDAVTDRLFGQPYDRDGRIAASGGSARPGCCGSPAPAIFSPQAT